MGINSLASGADVFHKAKDLRPVLILLEMDLAGRRRVDGKPYAGFDDYITKPVPERKMKALLDAPGYGVAK